ncbi:hypothetical protein DES40_0040 [Litorimonas taeanensis]|uniref:Uncharacterized protein n=1 Tax=Litorimonas taeanensis TaxID=568099 RepID=A0A420WI90_9PROT|nr:hypothetical protein [Litorimonas taeanensis]RKQ70741.1 hypothetical protein DES40_0040 [Litorimonas taeanensis]
MTPELLERDWLSLRYWARHCILPSAVILCILLILLNLFSKSEIALNHRAVIIGFFTIYYVLIRGGHILMTRSLHKELLRKYEDGYRHKLGYIPQGQIKRRNIGFTLARIKNQLMIEERQKRI